MYLNNFCFVLVVVTVSATYFDRELPLYLSDDILISKLPSISKRSILDNAETQYGGQEVSKRDVTAEERIENTKEKKKDGKHEGELENGEESGLVFIPSFGRRSRRSLPENDQSTGKPNGSSLSNEKKSEEGQRTDKEKDGVEIEKVEESGLVFIPSFGRRNRRSIPDNENKDETSKQDSALKSRTSSTTPKNDKINEDDIENKEESGLVFIPSFGRRSRRSILKNEDDLFSAENNIVFLPSFRRNGFRRFRRDVENTLYNFNKRSAEKFDKDNKSGKTYTPVTEQNEELSDIDAVNKQESGLVFLPSFGRRSRRSVVESQSTPSTHKVQEVTTSTPVLKTKRTVERRIPDDQEKADGLDENKDDESEEESGLVFIPSFGRRQRRDASSTGSTQKTTVTTVSPSTQDETVSKKTFSSQESGLVFLPSFNRRTRRDTKDEKQKKSDDSNGHLDVEQQESGLVFLPSFGRKT